MTENAGVEKKMEQSTEENVIEQRIMMIRIYGTEKMKKKIYVQINR